MLFSALMGIMMKGIHFFAVLAVLGAMAVGAGFMFVLLFILLLHSKSVISNAINTAFPRKIKIREINVQKPDDEDY